MLNRPLSPWGNDDDSRETRWNADHNPQFRLGLLWAAALLPVLAIIGRAAHLQLSLRDRFTAAFAQTTETVEEVPARDGRIFAGDGSILADDDERYDIAVYYPAIEDPPDDNWITAKAKPRLNKSDRKDKKKLQAEKEKVIAECDTFWKRLAELVGRPLNEVLELRLHEQNRIERIKTSVQRRHREQQQVAHSNNDHSHGNEGSSWSAVGRRLMQMIAEPPEPGSGPHLISEELGYHSVIIGVDAEVKEEIEAHPQKYPYAQVLVRTRRIYPQKDLASQLIGVRKPLSEEQYKTRQEAYPEGDPQDYRIGDAYGTSGLERSYDEILKGVRGKRVVIKNRRGQILETKTVREPRHGRDLALTLLPDVQHQAEGLLDEAATKVTLKGTVDADTSHGVFREPTCPRGGAIVAIDIDSGAILTAASAPRCDLNLQIRSDPAEWEDIISDARSPLLSRATQMALPPGSVFKIITAVASLESRKMNPFEKIHCIGYLDHPDAHRCLIFRHNHVGHGDVTLMDALCRSCNVYFYTAARRMGPETLIDWSRRFGIGQPTGIDLPSESSGRLPVPDDPQTTGERHIKWKPRNTLDMAIGQDELMVTPMQMARVMAAIANDGTLVTPHLAADLGPTALNESDSALDSFPKFLAHPIHGLHSDTLKYVREGLVEVVNKPGGTGFKNIRMREVTIAGKTGTAQTRQSGVEVDHAWFAGYVPAEQPRIAFVVVLENGGSGGAAAGPVAREFVKTLLESGLINKSDNRVNNRISKK